MNQWVSGSTMVLCTVIMSMVFLVTETRVRAGEKGINDPNVKLLLILGFFFCLGRFCTGSLSCTTTGPAIDE